MHISNDIYLTQVCDNVILENENYFLLSSTGLDILKKMKKMSLIKTTLINHLPIESQLLIRVPQPFRTTIDYWHDYMVLQ